MRIAVLATAALLPGCALMPVQNTTLRNANGDSITCSQVGRGVVSYRIGKSNYDDCIAKAKAQGYNFPPTSPAEASAAPTALTQASGAQGVAVAQQDTAEVETQFHSPMILTATFPLADRSLWGTGKWTDPELLRPFRDFRCDGVTIEEMRMRGKLRADGRLEVDVKGEFDSVAGHDKRVDMKVELLNGDTVVGVGYSVRLKAPEGEERRFGFDFDTPAGELLPATRLRITFSDYDD
jgi:hypothetical protein